ncbi:hypothetical protein IWW48_000253 [Coemansia sp. RSA 1200]|nr:hypothetical protein IWW48_000253 [Coemansia sp. RSA 1200]
MRLFRKTKAATPETQNVAMEYEPTMERSPSPYTPCPAPALELNLQLPSLASNSLIFEKNPPTSNEGAANAIIQRQQQQEQLQQHTAAVPQDGIPNYELTSAAYQGSQQAAGKASPQTILAAIDKRRGGGGGGAAGSGSNANASYNFDYPVHFAEHSDKTNKQAEASVQSMLFEQYGKTPSAAAGQQRQPSHHNYQMQNNLSHGTATATITNTTATSTSTTHAAATPSKHVQTNGGTLIEYIQAQQKQASLQKALYAAKSKEKTALANQQHPGSPSSRDDSSTSSYNDEGVQKLSGSMAAMSLGKGGAAEGKGAGNVLSERALYIQKAREASALGRVVTFNLMHAKNDDSDDENDTIPLGGLRKADDGCVSENTGGPVNALPGVGPSQAHGVSPHGSLVGGGQFGSAKQQALAQMQYGGPHMNQQAFQQYQMAVQSIAASSMPDMMGSLSAGARTPVPMFSADNSGQNSPAMSGAGGFPAQGGGPPMQQQGMTSMSLAQLQQQHQQHQQMAAYQRNASGGAQRAPMSSSQGAMFGNGGFYRGAMGDVATAVPSARPMYTPSPLGQMPPIYAHQGMVAGQAHMIVPDPRMAAAYQPTPSAQMPNAMAASINSFRSGAQQPLQQGFVASSAQQASLTSFIPTQSQYQGSFTRNPLMRDLNKIKEFSAKDYTARPTLLAEVDSRMLAKKNIPGLGGSASHSYQPQAQPQAQAQVQPQAHAHGQKQAHGRHPHSPTGRHRQINNSDQFGYDRRPERSNPDYYDRHYSSHRHDQGFENLSSYQNLYAMCNDNASVSSGGSSKRNMDMRGIRGGEGREHKRRHRHDHRGNAHGSEYGDGMPLREFRRTDARSPPPRGYRTLGRHYRRYRDDYYHEQYDFDDVSDMYASDYYDEWEGNDHEGYYGDDSVEYAHHRRHTVHRKSHRRQRAERRRAGSQMKPPQRHYRDESLVEHRGGPRKKLPMHLDDPRGSNGFTFRAAAAAPESAERTNSFDSQSPSQSSLISITRAKPRSQFGRMLANIKQRSANEPKAASKPEPMDTREDEEEEEQASTECKPEPTGRDRRDTQPSDAPHASAANSPAASTTSSMPDPQGNSPICTPKMTATAPVAAA